MLRVRITCGVSVKERWIETFLLRLYEAQLKIKRDNFPMALIDDVLDRLQGSKVFTTLDLANGFFYVPIKVESRKCTSFVTHNGHNKFTHVPFGISNSSAVFCRYVGAVLKDLMQSNKIVVYMDDIIIPTADKESGLSVLKENGTIAPTDDKVKAVVN